MSGGADVLPRERDSYTWKGCLICTVKQVAMLGGGVLRERGGNTWRGGVLSFIVKRVLAYS